MLTIVTDTSCALSRSEAEELGVRVVPMGYVCDGERHAEGFSGENGSYAQLFSAARVVTSEAVYASSFAAAFRELLEAGSDVVCITISSRLSGTFRSAAEAAEALDGKIGGRHVAVVDSWVTAGALEFLVRRAAAMAASGASLDEVVAAVERARAGQQVAFTVPDIGVLRRSGRLGVLRRSVATKLNRYPVMQLVEGGIRDVCMARGASGAGREMVALAPAGAHEFVLSHFGDRGIEAQRTLAAVKARFPHAVVRVKDGGPVLAKNLGLGAVSLAWEQPEA